jgi:cation diffusion facilitator CzcD-associated flavoprotein CzcO
MPSVISTDVLIVGAGVAGLWLNARLRRQGFRPCWWKAPAWVAGKA